MLSMRFGHDSLAIGLTVCMLLFSATSKAQTAAPSPSSSVEGKVLSITDHQLSVAVPHDFTITGDAAQQKLDTISVGDTVELTPDKSNPGAAAAKDLEKRNKTVPVSAPGRLLAGFIAFVLVLIVAALATGGLNNGRLAFGNPLSFCVGVDNRTSNSQTQMVLWSATVLTVYLATIFLRGWMTNWDFLAGVGIPTNLLAFSGLSALSFGGARAITVSKISAATAGTPAAMGAPATAEDAAKDAQAKAAAAASAVEAAQAASNNSGAVAAGAAIDAAEEAARIADAAQAAGGQASGLDTPDGASIKHAPAGTAHITQLFQDDKGRPDLGDTQMILITMIAIATYVVTVFHYLGNLELAPQVSLPDIDSYLLASFGIGQGAYLTKKAASPLGL